MNNAKRTFHIRGRKDQTRGELERACGSRIMVGAISIDGDSVERRRCRGRHVCVIGRAVHRGHWKTRLVGIFTHAGQKLATTRQPSTTHKPMSMLGAFKPTATLSVGLLWFVYILEICNSAEKNTV